MFGLVDWGCVVCVCLFGSILVGNDLLHYVGCFLGLLAGVVLLFCCLGYVDWCWLLCVVCLV